MPSIPTTDNGNLTQKRVGTAAVNYLYNSDNRLIRVEDDLTGVIIAEYGYDPFWAQTVEGRGWRQNLLLL